MHKYPAIHNAMWPGLVGKGPDSEPPIDLETMLNLTAAASVGGVKFDGVDLFLFDPARQHRSSTDDDVKRLADQVASRNLVVGSRRGAGVASDRRRLRDGERGGAQELRHAGPQGLHDCEEAQRISASANTASSASTRRRARATGLADPAGNQKKIAETFRQACDVADGYGERLAAEGEICWGGMHSWKRNVELLELVNRPKTLGFQADMAHTLLFTLGYNAPEDRILPEGYDWSSAARRWTRRSRR